jgi:hypothetical protein
MANEKTDSTKTKDSSSANNSRPNNSVWCRPPQNDKLCAFPLITMPMGEGRNPFKFERLVFLDAGSSSASRKTLDCQLKDLAGPKPVIFLLTAMSWGHNEE